MIPLVIAAVVILSVVSAAIILKGPNKENETMQEARMRAMHEEQRLANERERVRQERLLELERRKVREKEAEVKRWQAELAQERLAAERRRASAQVVKARKAEEEESRRREEEARKEKEEKALCQIAEEKKKLKARRQMIERREKEQQEAIEKQKKEQAAQLEAEKRFGGPLRWPTSEEFQSALVRTEYNSSDFHFAIVGRAGSGKSSLINAFRNLRNIDDEAAPTGTTETTLEIGRYRDPGIEAPRKWMVWFDVPGAGTQSIPSRDYFIRQGLYIFDLVVLALGDRFEEIDVRIVEDCARFKVPLFIVRSKADMNILNAMKEHGDYARIKENPTLYVRCRTEFVKQTQRSVSEGLKREGLPDQQVYIVSRDMLQRTYNSALQGQRWPEALERDLGMIHERHLVKKLLDAAAERRCETTERWSVAEMQKVVDDSQLKDMALGAVGFLKETLTGLFNEREGGDDGAHTSPCDVSDFLYGRGQPGRARAQAKPRAIARWPPTPGPTLEDGPHENIRKILYPPQQTTSDALYAELDRSNPALCSMLVERPQMFSPKVALLTFLPRARVPSKVSAFGEVLHVKEFEERRKLGAAAGRGRGRGGSGQTVRVEEDAEGRGRGNSRGGGRGGRGSENATRRGRMGRGWRGHGVVGVDGDNSLS